MKKYLFSSMLLGGLMMASCSENVLETPQVEETQKTYAQKFQEMLGGPVSRTQDFKTVKESNLNVTLAANGDIKVYARINAEVVYKLVGYFENMPAGSHDLVFDAPENWNDYAVEVGNEVKQTNGAAVAFNNTPGSRTYYQETENVFALNETVNGEAKRIQKIFTLDEVKGFDAILPAGINNYDKNGIAFDFKVMNETSKKVKIYPIYWVADYKHNFGIYTYKDNGEIDQKYFIYKSKDATDTSDLMVSYDGTETWESAVNSGNYYAYRLTPTQGDNIGARPASTKIPTHVKSQGFEVTLPDKGKTYGFFIEVWKGNTLHGTFYSDKKFNTDNMYHAAYFQAEVPSPIASVEETITRTYLGFEDVYNGGDKDLNDFMFIVEPEPVIIDKTPLSWTLAAEDLGNLDDFDFNDVVVSLEKIAGQSKLKIRALAAGGTLPVYLQYNDETIGGEFHTWFEGVTPGTYPMINTKTNDKVGAEYTLTVAPNYTLTKFMDATDNNMGGFKIVVERPDGTTSELTSPKEKGTAPQMMCLPCGWAWPTERTRVVDAYPGFGHWGQGYIQDATNAWAYLYNEGKVVK